jgi:hypothetical protein
MLAADWPRRVRNISHPLTGPLTETDARFTEIDGRKRTTRCADDR